MRVAVYARYSSDLQDARSITDQLALARDYAARQGWSVVAEFSDAAISGASISNRPGLQGLMMRSDQGEFDAVLCESVDRISRDLEHIAGIYKRLTFRGVQLVTIAEGVADTIHIGLRGIVSKLYLEDLAQKTRRGQVGRARAGRIPGGRCYGYDVVAGGERGRRTINEREAEIVRRIFREYAAGVSPMTIVRALNTECIPGPRGGPWNISALLGSPKRGNGLLNNELYVGRLVYNRQRFIKDPATGRRQARANPPGEWLAVDVPELSVVDASTWAAVHEHRAALGGKHLTHRRRPKHLLSGLLCCGTCGATMIVQTRMRDVTYFGCSVRINRGGCSNTRLAPSPDIEARVLAGLKRLLLAPDAVELAVETYRAERTRLAQEQARSRGMVERALADTRREIGRVTQAIRVGGELQPLITALQELDARRQQLEARLPSLPPDVVVPHPQAAGRYRQMVEQLEHDLSSGQPAAARASGLVRGLVRSVRVLPTPGRQPLGLELAGDLAALIRMVEGASPTDMAASPLALIELRI